MSMPAPTRRDAWMAEVAAVADRDRWGRALLVVAVVHLLFFGACQGLIWTVGRTPRWPYPTLWLAEVLATTLVARLVCGRGWHRASPMAGVVVRVWITYLILAFNLSTLNQLTGWQNDWFKAAWCTLATYGFATMAWLLSLWFLVPAVQMYFTGLAIVRFPREAYLIHGLSFGLALIVIGVLLERRRLRRPAGPPAPAIEADAPSTPPKTVKIPRGPAALATWTPQAKPLDSRGP